MTLVEAVLIVRGVVQGVNFRSHCRQLAQKHGVTGYAKNLADGSVEVLACGGEEKIGAFVQELRSARPFPARVDEVREISRKACTAPPRGFERL